MIYIYIFVSATQNITMLSFMFIRDMLHFKLMLIKLSLLNKLSILVYTKQYNSSFDYYKMSWLTDIRQDLYLNTVFLIEGI